jgi:hypothetical protein
VHVYNAYGLCFHSEVSLPLEAGHGAADVMIRHADLARTAVALRADGIERRAEPGEVSLLFRDRACFSVRSGSEILVDAASESIPTAITLALLGPVMAALLKQRGFLVLHASAVAVDGGAIAIMGASGWGKSTLAALLHTRGCPLIVDDIVAIHFVEGVPHVYPGSPQMKLWPDSLESIGESPENFPRLYEEREKRALRIESGFHRDGPLPLHRIYVLGHADHLELEPLSSHDAFLELTGHSFGIEWLQSLSTAEFFHQRTRIASGVPVRALRRPRDLELLADAADLILQDCVTGAGTGAE